MSAGDASLCLRRATLAGSIALIAFGLDSAIEGLASVIVIWRFTGTRTTSADAERRAQQWVAISFFLLAPYVAAEAMTRVRVMTYLVPTLLGRACGPDGVVEISRRPIRINEVVKR